MLSKGREEGLPRLSMSLLQGVSRLSTFVDMGEEGVKIWLKTLKTLVEWTDPMQNFHLKAVQNSKFLDASLNGR